MYLCTSPLSFVWPLYNDYILRQLQDLVERYDPSSRFNVTKTNTPRVLVESLLTDLAGAKKTISQLTSIDDKQGKTDEVLVDGMLCKCIYICGIVVTAIVYMRLSLGDIIFAAKDGLPSSPWEHYEGLGLSTVVPKYLRYEVSTFTLSPLTLYPFHHVVFYCVKGYFATIVAV